MNVFNTLKPKIIMYLLTFLYFAFAKSTLKLLLNHLFYHYHSFLIICAALYSNWHSTENKPLFIYILLPFLNEARFVQSEKIWGKGEFSGKSGEIREIRKNQITFLRSAEICIFQTKSENLLNFLNFWNLVLKWNLHAYNWTLML